MNTPSTALIRLTDSDGYPLLMSVFPKHDALRNVTPILNAHSTAVAMVFIQPGVAVSHPIVAAVLLKRLERHPSVNALAAILERKLQDNPRIVAEPDDEVRAAVGMALNALSLPGALASHPVEASLRAVSYHPGTGRPRSRIQSHGTARFSPADGLLSQSPELQDSCDLATGFFRDLDGFEGDGVCVTAVSGFVPVTAGGVITTRNNSGRWVAHYLGHHSCTALEDEATFVGFSRARRLALPGVAELVFDLGYTLGSVAADILKDPSQNVIDLLVAQSSEFVDSWIGPASSLLPLAPFEAGPNCLTSHAPALDMLSVPSPSRGIAPSVMTFIFELALPTVNLVADLDDFLNITDQATAASIKQFIDETLTLDDIQIIVYSFAQHDPMVAVQHALSLALDQMLNPRFWRMLQRSPVAWETTAARAVLKNLPRWLVALDKIVDVTNYVVSLTHLIIGITELSAYDEYGIDACSYTFQPQDAVVSSEGASAFTVDVSTQVACNWAVTAFPDWISLSGRGTGEGPGWFVLSIQPNLSSSLRKAEIAVSGHSVTLTQQGATAPIGPPQGACGLNSTANDFGPSLSGDGLTMFYVTTRLDGTSHVFSSTRPDRQSCFGPPVYLSGVNVGGGISDQRPEISSDGLSLYFSSNRLALPIQHLYEATRASVHDNFGPARYMLELSPGGYSDGGPSITPDGLTLFFDSDRPGGKGGYDIWIATRPNTASLFGPPSPLAQVNSGYNETGAEISADGLTLLFASNRPGGLGDSDIWVAQRSSVSDPFGVPFNFSRVNSPWEDAEPSLSADSAELFFQSTRPGGLGGSDVWVSSGSISPEEPRLLGSWSLDEGSGLIANDSSGNGYTGTLHGATWVSGGVSLGGSNNTVTFPDGPFQLPNGTWDVVIRAKPGGAGGWVVCKDNIGYRDDGILSIGPGGEVYFDMHVTPSITYRAEASVPVGTVVRVTLQWGTGGMKIFVNGSLAGSNPYTGPILSPGRPLSLGNGISGGTLSFDGDILDLKVYSGHLITVSPVQDDSVFSWSFEGADAGIIAHDTSGNGRDGAVAGAVVDQGASGQALRFSGGVVHSQYVLLPDSDALTPAAATIDLWFNPTDLPLDGNNYMIVHKYQNGVPGNSDYLLELMDRKLYFSTRGGRALVFDVLEANTWYHVTAIANGADSHLWVNGTHVTGELEPIPNGNEPFMIGTCWDSCEVNNRTFNGRIDEVRLYNGVRVP